MELLKKVGMIVATIIFLFIVGIIFITSCYFMIKLWPAFLFVGMIVLISTLADAD